MPDFKIRDPNTGRVITLRGDSPPTEQELEEMFASQPETSAPVQEEAKPAPFNAKQEAMDAVNMGGPNVGWENTKEHPYQTAAMLALPFLGKAASAATPYVAPVLARAALSPVGQAVIGGGVGYATGGPIGGVIGAAGGFTGAVTGKGKINEFLTRHGLSKTPDAKAVITEGMSQSGAHADDRFNAILAKVKAKNPAAWADAPMPAPAPTAPVVTPKTPLAQSLENALGKRIDWRTTDAVPIDAMKSAMGQGGSIIEAGESIPGLADRMAALLKQNTPTAIQDAQTLAKAIRQRGHITAKGTR